jgi:hypothetical protein
MPPRAKPIQRATDPPSSREPAPLSGRLRLARALLLAYAGYAAAATMILSMADRNGLIDAAIVVSVLAGSTSVLLAVRFDRPMTRRHVIAAHTTLVPIQFIVSIPSNLPLLGLLVSAAIVVAMKPVFPQLKPPRRRFFLTLHVAFSVAWLGLSLSMGALSIIGMVTDEAALRHDVYRIMHIFDLVLVIPIVLLCLLSGLVMSLCTKWGLTRHWWVLLKFVIALSIPLAAGFAQERWIGELIERTAIDPTFRPGGTGAWLAAFMIIYVVLLTTATTLSVYKPGALTPWSRRGRTASRTADRTTAVTTAEAAR